MLGMIENMAMITQSPPLHTPANSYRDSGKGHFRGMLKDAVDRTSSPRRSKNPANAKKSPTDTPADNAAAAQTAGMTATVPNVDQPPDTTPQGTDTEATVQPLSGSPPPQKVDVVDAPLSKLPVLPTDLTPDTMNNSHYGVGMTAEEYAAYIAAKNTGETEATPPPTQETATVETPATNPVGSQNVTTKQTVLQQADAATTTVLPTAGSPLTAPAQTGVTAPPQTDSAAIPDGDDGKVIVHVQSATNPTAGTDEKQAIEAEKSTTPANQTGKLATEPEKAGSAFGDRVGQAARQLADLRMSKGYQGTTTPDSKTGTAANTATGTASNTATATKNTTKATAEITTAPPEAQIKGTEPQTRVEQHPGRVAQTQSAEEETTPETTVAEMNATPPRASFSDAVGRILDRQHVAETSPAGQIETEILKNMENQKMEFRMQLQPADLGKVDVRMVLESGKLVVEIISSAKTNEMLARQADSLATALRLDNPELSSVQVVTETAQSGTAYLENALTGGDAYAGRQNSESHHTANPASQTQRQSETEELIGADTFIRQAVLSRTLDYSI
jgi:hypothetical protein